MTGGNILDLDFHHGLLDAKADDSMLGRLENFKVGFGAFRAMAVSVRASENPDILLRGRVRSNSHGAQPTVDYFYLRIAGRISDRVGICLWCAEENGDDWPSDFHGILPRPIVLIVGDTLRPMY
jgi:hypothetical protein